MSEYLTRDSIVTAAHGFLTEEVEVPEWGGTVLVRELTVPEVTKLGMTAVGQNAPAAMAGSLSQVPVDLVGLSELFPEIVAWTVVDAEMNPLLMVDDVRQMTGRFVAPVQRIAGVALALSNLGTDEDEDASSDPAQAEDSSVLPDPS